MFGECNVQVAINRHRIEMNDVQVKLNQEQQKFKNQAAISDQLESQLRDKHKDLKVRLHCPTINPLTFRLQRLYM